VPGGSARTRWLREVGEGAAGVIAISGGVRDDLLALGIDARKILVEHDAFEPARFANIPTRDAARERIGVDANAKLVVYTGGLLEWKGVDLLVDAARELPDATFVIAGGMAADVERLRERARGAGNLRIDGFQAPGKVLDYLAAADVAVVPNRSQPAISARYTSPLKVFEAMAVGTPLVASDLPSLRELLTHDVDAWLVRADDASALVGGIRRLLDDAALRTRLGTELCTRAPRHTWDARAARILAWIAERTT
jgi:glycosyltransferase involved in cell wall biosynthesis